MESTAFFERKIALTPRDLNPVGVGERNGVDDLILRKLKQKLEEKCSEHGFVLPGIKLLSRSMGAFEAARFTGDAVYFVKAEGRVLYPVDGMRVQGQVIRKNKMGLYVNYRDGLRIQVPRDLHLGNDAFEDVVVGDMVEVELKKAIFQINDPYILTNGLFLRRAGGAASAAMAAAAAVETEATVAAAEKEVAAAEGVADRAVAAGAGAGAAAAAAEEDEEVVAAVEENEEGVAAAEAIAAQAAADAADAAGEAVEENEEDTDDE
jgi:hypothetical protein